MRSVHEGEAISGVWAAVLSPVTNALAPDPKRFADHALRLLERGCHGIVAFGTTGEAASFSVAERIGMVEVLAAAGIDLGRVVVGTGTTALSDTVDLTEHARDLGAAGVLLIPPFYYKDLSDDGLYRSFAEIIDRVGSRDLSVYLYHFPQMSTVPIPPAVIGRLLEAYPGIVVGIKDSSGDAAGTATLIEHFPGLAVLPGNEVLLLDMLARGGAGCITATANVNPDGIRRVYDAWRAGDGDLAASFQSDATRVRQSLAGAALIPTLKALVAHATGDPAWRNVRPPFAPSDVPDVAELASSLSLLAAGAPYAESATNAPHSAEDE